MCYCSNSTSGTCVTQSERLETSTKKLFSVSEACHNFISTANPIYRGCMDSISRYVPRTSPFTLISRSLDICKEYWGTYYCCMICVGIHNDEIDGKDMNESLQAGLSGLTCDPHPVWNPNVVKENDNRCILSHDPPQSRIWYKNNLCGNFVRNFKSNYTNPVVEDLSLPSTQEQPTETPQIPNTQSPIENNLMPNNPTPPEIPTQQPGNHAEIPVSEPPQENPMLPNSPVVITGKDSIPSQENPVEKPNIPVQIENFNTTDNNSTQPAVNSTIQTSGSVINSLVGQFVFIILPLLILQNKVF